MFLLFICLTIAFWRLTYSIICDVKASVFHRIGFKDNKIPIGKIK